MKVTLSLIPVQRAFQFVEAERKHDHNHAQRQDGFAHPRVARRRLAQNRQPRREQRQRSPHDQERHAIHAGDGGDLNERQQAKLRIADEQPRKTAEQTAHDHFQRHPIRRARQRPQRAPAPTPKAFGAVAFAGFARQQPNPRGWIQREIGAQRHPAQNGISRDGNQQQPVKRGKIERESAEVADAESGHAGFAARRQEQQRRRDPGESGDADFGKGCREQPTGREGERVTAAKNKLAPKIIQRDELAAKASKGKFSR